MKSRRHDLPHSLLAVASRAGMARAEQSPAQRFVLAASAGIFIAIAAAFYVSLSQQPNTLVSVLASGLCFTLSLIPVVLGGAELFPSMLATTAAAAGGYISPREALCSGLIVCAGNTGGILFLAALMWFSGLCTGGDGRWGLRVLQISAHHPGDTFITNLGLGMVGNLLLCFAVAISHAFHSLTDKILAMLLPLSLFSASGAAHGMVSLFLLPLAVAVQSSAPARFGLLSVSDNALSAGYLLAGNLFPLVLGNLIGGGLLLLALVRLQRHHA